MIIDIDNFITKDEAKDYINFIESNLASFNVSDERQEYPNTRYMLRFGYDEERPDLVRTDYSILDPIRNSLIALFDKIIDKISSEFHDEVFLTSFFLSKHIPSKEVSPHRDSLPGFNEQLDYTILLYLNNLDGNGALFFTDSETSITPKTGKLVAFDTKGPDGNHGINEILFDRYSIPIWLTKDAKYKLVW